MFLYVVLTLVLWKDSTAASLVCLYCTDAVSPADCDTVIKCGSHESCYVDAFVKASGSIRYNLGCRDENQCKGSLNNGRREITHYSIKPMAGEFDAMLNTSKALSQTSTLALSNNSPNLFKTSSFSKRTNGLLICSECCKGNLCSNTGCGNEGYISKRGPICYSCAQQISPDDCFKIALCSQGEVCMLKKALSPMTNEVRYATRCEREQSCNDEILHYKQLASLLIGKRGKRNSFEAGIGGSDCLILCFCFNAVEPRLLQWDFLTSSFEGSCVVQCCQTDMCNINCNKTSTSTTITPVPTVTMTTPPTKGNETGGATRQSQTFASTASYCTYKKTKYNQGDVWQDGCQYNCTCEDARTGYYRCQDLCPVWIGLPANCTLEKKLGDCCYQPNCEETSLHPGGTANTCYYGGKYYHEGYQWKVGCKYKCTCQDGKTGFYQCQTLCIQWKLPQRCHLDPPPAGKCCQVPVCPTNVQLQYPPGYGQE